MRRHTWTVHVLAACTVAFLAGCGASGDASGGAHFVLDEDATSPGAGTVGVVLGASLLRALERADPDDVDWQNILSVHTGTEEPAPDAPGVLGRWTIESGRLRFTPRFAAVPGQPYYVRFDREALAAVAREPSLTAPPMDTVLLVPRDNRGGGTRVARIYPTTSVLPENVLRMYVHFTAPMSMGEAYVRLRLLDERGRDVEDPFLIVPQELWDPERQRLTILFDPGRIKRGLLPNEESGTPLHEGGKYTLVVDAAWRDAHGDSLAASHVKRFTVGPADRTAPSTKAWALTSSAAAGTQGGVTIVFGEPLDRALLERLITVQAADGNVVAGTVAVTDEETRWSFTPEVPWTAGDYAVLVGTDLEDLAGNNLRGVFDVDRNQPAPPAPTAQHVRIPLIVRER
jgi:hypothetical protein